MFDDLIKMVGDMGYEIFAYADDVAVIGLGVNRLCEKWTIKNKMKINKAKSGVIWHKGK